MIQSLTENCLFVVCINITDRPDLGSAMRQTSDRLGLRSLHLLLFSSRRWASGTISYECGNHKTWVKKSSAK